MLLMLPGRSCLPILLCLLALLACAPDGAQAQEAPLSPADAAAAPPVDLASVPVERATPRATVQTFLKSLLKAAESAPGESRTQLLDAAAATLDTSSLVTREQARNLAIKLKAGVLDRYARVVYEEIPDAPVGPPFVLVDTPVGEVVVARMPAGDWRFTRETVDAIDTLAEYFAGSGLAEGITPIDALATPADYLRQAMPQALLQRAFILCWYQWIGIAVLIVLALVAGRVLAYAALSLLNRWLRHFGAEAGDAQRAKLAAPLTYSIASVIWWAFDRRRPWSPLGSA